MSGYFCAPDGRHIYFADIDNAIEALHPSARGKHIFVQLEALNLRKVFDKGSSPCGLPFTFTGCATQLKDAA